MYVVKQSAALTVPIFVHDVNGDAVTGLVDAGFTKRISKGSGAFAAMTVTITEMENGFYSVPLSTVHTNTTGLLTMLFTHASGKQVNLQFRIEAKLVDDLNDVAATAIVSGGAIDTTGGAVDIVTTLTNLPSIPANWLTAAGIAASALNGKGDWNTVAPDNSGITGIQTDLSNTTDGLGALKILIDAIQVNVDSMGITKNETFSNFEFPMVLTSDHYTAATAKTVTGERSIDGGAFAAVSGTIAEVGSGVYQIDLLALDTNGDTITYKFSGAACDDTIITVTTRA